MSDIIWSICAIAVLIAIGWWVRHRDIVGAQTSDVLATLCYWGASPAMLFSAVSSTDVAHVLGQPLLVSAASGLGSALLFVALAAGVARVRGGDLVLGAMSASLNNAAYIGIPIAVYVLADASHVVPILVFQLGFFTPMFFVLADLAGSSNKPRPWSIIRTVITNPMVLAAVTGFVFSWSKLRVPRIVEVTTSMLGEAAPAMILLAFGASLVGQRFSFKSTKGIAILLASGCKLVAQPLIAWAVGYAIGMSPSGLMAVTVMAGLPTAQNAFIAATRAKTGQEIAQGTVLATTFASLPLTILTAWLFRIFAGV
ncbi:AEC family transporter [Schaalia vaccimaxillae]|uniref:AEC family transporter n=1 Tax=Schaalia vaccimaxillae TaxID=183916 RepID=UPI00047BF135|nr:AEC family transporter [Schaalia vaccimaxillae]